MSKSSATGVFTPANSFTVTSFALYKFGKVCMLNMTVSHTNDIPSGSWTSLGTLAADYVPCVQVCAMTDVSSYQFSRCLISNITGAININPSERAMQANTAVVVWATYLID